MTDAGHDWLDPALEAASTALGAVLLPVAAPISDGSRAAVVRARRAATWNNVAGFVAALQGAAGSSGPVDPAGLPRLLEDGWARLREAVEQLGLSVDERVRVEITQLSELGETRVVSPTDACPDNNVSTVGGLRLIDFGCASVMHPAWDIAYLHVPWPSCWCAWQLPADVTELAHHAWLSRLSAGLADRGLVLDEQAMDAAIRRASLVWCLITVGWFLPRAVAGRRAAGPRAPDLTAVIQHRLELIAAAELPGITASQGLARRLVAVLASRWTAPPLPLAPAFGGR
jgi:hypothetical protein